MLIPAAHRVATLVVVEDELTRLGLRHFLRSVEAVGEVVEATGRDDAVRLAQKIRPGLVVVDLTATEDDAAAAVSALVDDLAALRLDAPFLIYTGDPPALLERCGRFGITCRCLTRGRDSAGQLCRAIDSVLPGRCRIRGEPPVSPAVVEPAVTASLTAREREILSRVAAGEPSRGIAQALGISLRTVESHRAKVCAKLGVRTVAGLTKVALNAGLTALDGSFVPRRP